MKVGKSYRRDRYMAAASLTAITIAVASMAASEAYAESAPPTGAGISTVGEVIVTATKRTEKLQKVPVAVQVLDNQALAQHNVNNFQDYLKLVPSLTLQTMGPELTTIYLRGVSAGDNMNHSGPLPSVGVYLDEMPITTIGAVLDVHPYDMARLEVLPGPQGTLFGASSESGTVRMITNQPDPSHFSAGYSVEGNGVAHGGDGYVLEGFANIPITDKIALRLVGFDERDAGWINNVYGTRTFATSGVTINNGNELSSESKGINQVDQYGGRAALKIDLNDNWTVTPQVIVQDMKTPLGIPGYMAGTNLQTQRFQSDAVTDVFGLAGLTVNGRVGNFDLTYAGSMFVRGSHAHVDYTDYSIAYDQAYGSGHNWVDSAGNPLPAPLVRQDDKDSYNKYSNEIRLASPATDRLRFQVGAFQEYQVHNIEENYEIQGFSSTLSVPGYLGDYWLTKEQRTDRDYAVFTEASYDITPKLTVTGGVRGYYYDNDLYGYYGFSEAYDKLLGSNTGMGMNGQNCIPGKTYTFGNTAPCVNLDKSATGSGETHKINLSYKFDDLRMVYFTYSTGYRPGGVNRNGTLPPYLADTLENFEVGVKSQWFDRRLTVNAALYDEELQNFQFAFYGLNDLTEIQNAPGANIKGFEASFAFRPVQALTLSGDLTLQDPHLDNNVCPSNPTTGAIIKTCSDSVAVALNGTHLPFTSQVKGSLTARYSFDLSQAYHAHVQGSLAYRGSETLGLRLSDQEALGSLPAFTTFDLSTGVDHENISMELFVKNVSDERGLLNRYSICNDAVCKQLYDVSVPPRTIGLRLSQKF